MQYHSFGLAKRGNSAAEYEDAVAAAPAAQRFAIADGATDSSFANVWAKLLVDAFVQQPIYRPTQWRSWLPPLQERWTKMVGDPELPWYAEAKLQQGAFATFLGLVLSRKNCFHGNRWWAIAVGDCCLFQIRQQQVHHVFPITCSADFNNRPGLVSSRLTAKGGAGQQELLTCKGTWEVGDQIWLMTDALAKWFLGQWETGNQPAQAVEQILAAAKLEDFTAWIEQLRDTKEIRNDDVTLLAIPL